MRCECESDVKNVNELSDGNRLPLELLLECLLSRLPERRELGESAGGLNSRMFDEIFSFILSIFSGFFFLHSSELNFLTISKIGCLMLSLMLSYAHSTFICMAYFPSFSIYDYYREMRVGPRGRTAGGVNGEAL